MTQLPWPFIDMPITDPVRDFAYVGLLPTVLAAAALLAGWAVARLARRRPLKAAQRLTLFTVFVAGLTIVGYVGMASTWALTHTHAKRQLATGPVTAPAS